MRARRRPKTYMRPIAPPKKPVVDGHKFDSAAESWRYADLKRLQDRGLVRGLEVHPRLPMVINGRKVGRGYMVLDFTYEAWIDGAWRKVWEDFKRFDTDLSRFRRKVCEAINGITITVKGLT